MIQVAQIAMMLSSSLFSPPIVDEGMATFYTYQDYGGGPLYAHSSAIYDQKNDLNWCAVNEMAYLTGQVEPGDKLLIRFMDYDKFIILEAWDAGPFDGYYIADYPELPILVDVPLHLWPLTRQTSARVEIVNLSAMERQK